MAAHYLDIAECDTEFTYAFEKGHHFSNWIKGGETTNPALDFYGEISKIDDVFFLPECPFKDIVPLDKTDESYAVDFYAPFLGVVFEIDGAQHKESKLDDLTRDRLLSEYRVRCYRITTNEVRAKKYLHIFDEIQKRAAILRQRAEESGIHIAKRGEISRRFELSCFFFRLQVLLLEMLASSVLDIEVDRYKIYLSSDIDFPIEACEIAYADLCQLVEKLFALDNINQSLPKLEFVIENGTKDELGAIHARVDVYGLYDDRIDSEKRYWVANDYFFFAEKGKKDGKKYYPRYKDYYEVAVDPLRFNHVSESNPRHISSLNYFLNLLFGYESFRPKQIEIISRGLSSENGVIGILPTGSGKSVCYQIAGFLTPGISVVVCPLRVLMEDQCQDLSEFGITRAYYINSSAKSGDEKARDIAMRAFAMASTKLLYISPERFFNKEFQKQMGIQAKNVCQFAIDEVHCLSEWGHDFRTSYLLLFGFLKKFGFEDVLLIGTSATASPQVINDIIAEFSQIKRQVVTIKAETVKRPELTFEVIKTAGDDNGETLSSIISSEHACGHKSLVFCAYKTSTQAYYDMFANPSSGLKVGLYHGDKGDVNTGEAEGESLDPDETKGLVLDLFKNDQIETVFATKAFGMGVNIKNIRRCVHTQFASSVEALYQEMGRAGRDGDPSTCTVIYPFSESCEDNIHNLFENETVALDSISRRKGEYGGLDQQIFLLKESNLESEDEAWLAFEILVYLKKIVKDGRASFTLKSRGKEKGIYAYLEELAASKSESATAISNMLGKTKKYAGKDMPPITMFGQVQTFIDRALYQLYILRLIDLWEINYGPDMDNPQYTNIVVNVKEGVGNNAFALERLITYIRRYEPTYSIDVQNPESQTVRFYLSKLTEWSHDHFFMSRWNSLKTLHDFVVNFKSSDEFAERINSYFVESRSLQDALAKPLDYRLWFVAINADEPEQLRDRLFRAFEENGDTNVAANFVSALNRIRLGDFEQHDGRGRFALAWDQIETFGMDAPTIHQTALSVLDEQEAKIYWNGLYEYLIRRDAPHPLEMGLDSETNRGIKTARGLRKLNAAIRS